MDSKVASNIVNRGKSPWIPAFAGMTKKHFPKSGAMPALFADMKSSQTLAEKKYLAGKNANCTDKFLGKGLTDRYNYAEGRFETAGVLFLHKYFVHPKVFYISTFKTPLGNRKGTEK